MTIVGDILEVALRLDGKRDQLRQGRRERRDRAADLLSSVADTIDRVVADVDRGEVPHGACAQMRAHARALPDALGEHIGRAEADDLAYLLERSYEVERLVVELAGHPRREEEIARLAQAGGLIRAEAEVLRATA